MAGIGSYLDVLRQGSNRWEQISESEALEDTAKTDASGDENKPQTLEEFKREVYGLLNSMYIHPSQSKTQISISISDKAFEKMMNDPEYKKEILNVIQRDLGAAYPARAEPTYSCLRIGDDGEYRGDAMGAAFEGEFSTRSANSFWEKNTDRSAATYDQSKRNRQTTDEKRLTEKYAMDRLLEKRDLDQLLQEKNQAQALQKKKILQQYENNLMKVDIRRES